MRRFMRSLPGLWLAAAIAAGGAAHAQAPELRRYELPNLDTLELLLPPGWADRVDHPPGGKLTIELGPAQGAPFQVFVTPEWTDPTSPEVRELPALRVAVRDAAERIKPQVVESFLEVRHLAGANGVGYYFQATDRAPRADGFKYMSEGALQVGDLTLWFTILTNDGQDTVAVEALSILQTAVHRRTGVDRR